MDTLKTLLRDTWRIGALIVVALVLFKLSPILSGYLLIPELETYGNFSAFAFAGLATVLVARRVIFPYAHMHDLYEDMTISGGLKFLGICIFLAVMALAMRPVQASELPPGAVIHIPTLRVEVASNWPDMPLPSALAAQVEQETCASLKSPRCWNTHAELKTDREYGFGLGQCTVTHKFNCFNEMKRQHAGLRGWSWEDRFDASYQLRALVLQDRAGYQAFTGATTFDRLAFAFAAYNGGAGGIRSDRMTCKATPGCDPARWFGHVERTSYKAKLAVKGYGKSFFEINREYVRNVLVVRRPRYAQAMGDA